MLQPRLKRILIKMVRSIFFRQRHIILKRRLDFTKISLDNVRTVSIRDDAKALEDLKNHIPHKASVIDQRLDVGVDCYLVYNDKNEMMAYCWYASKDFYEPKQDFHFKLKKGEVYTFDAELLEAFRGQFMITSKLNYIFWQHFLELGFDTIVCMIDMNNTESIRLMAFLNFKETGEMIITHFIFTKPYTYRKRYTGKYLRLH